MLLRVEEKQLVAAETMRIRFADPLGNQLPGFKPGARVEIAFAHMVRRYSLTSSPQALDHYDICVLRCHPSRGGSLYLHEELVPGQLVSMSEPHNAFPLKLDAEHSVFVAGGIGITPFLSMMETLQTLSRSFELHYAARSVQHFLGSAAGLEATTLYCPDSGRPALRVQMLLAELDVASHLYVCGPRSLMEAVRTAARDRGWPSERVHVESFGSALTADDRPITLRLAQSGALIVVQPGTSILDALLANGIWAPYGCRRGECASCVTEVISGQPDHRDVCLTDAQRRNTLCTCISWAHSAELELDL